MEHPLSSVSLSMSKVHQNVRLQNLQLLQRVSFRSPMLTWSWCFSHCQFHNLRLMYKRERKGKKKKENQSKLEGRRRGGRTLWLGRLYISDFERMKASFLLNHVSQQASWRKINPGTSHLASCYLTLNHHVAHSFRQLDTRQVTIELKSEFIIILQVVWWGVRIKWIITIYKNEGLNGYWCFTRCPSFQHCTLQCFLPRSWHFHWW